MQMTERTGRKSIVLEDTARSAIAGDPDALDQLVRGLQDDLYHLSLRMLCNREDAEDATQEILVRIITRLSQFDFRSKLKTWAYRVAVNYILDVKKSTVEKLDLSFEKFSERLTNGQSSEAPSEAEQSLLIEEVKIRCTFGMLQCLDRSHRLAYILGEIMEIPGPEAAEVLDVSSDLFRKRLQHARTAILHFTKNHCGVISDTAPCKCNRMVPKLLRSGKISAGSCQYAAAPSSFQQIKAMVRQVDEARWAFQVHRTSNPRVSSIDFARQLVEKLEFRRDQNQASWSADPSST
jgi:RNA polymerase sigma factor (sigma-70 family)